MRRSHGYAPRGQRAVSIEPFQAEIRQTVLAGLSTRGILAPLILNGAMDGPSFVAWLDQELLPEMRPGDILVLDNLPIHHGKAVAPCLERAGVHLEYVPPYSPDLSPIEPMWSKVKAFMRKIGAGTEKTLRKPSARRSMPSQKTILSSGLTIVATLASHSFPSSGKCFNTLDLFVNHLPALGDFSIANPTPNYATVTFSVPFRLPGHTLDVELRRFSGQSRTL